MSIRKTGARPEQEPPYPKVTKAGFRPLLAWAVCGLLAGAAAAQQDVSPLASSHAQENLPDASRFPGGELERVESGRRLPQTAISNLASLATEGQDLVAAELPAGISLTDGTATLVMAEEGATTLAAPSTGSNEIDPEQLGRGLAGIGSAAGAQKWFLTYRVQYRGVPVAKYSDLLAIVGPDGNLLYVRKRNLPTALDATQPTVLPRAALAAARRHLGAAGSGATNDAAPALEVWVEPTLRGQLSWTFNLRTASLTQPVARQYWIAAVGTPRILHWEDLVFHTHAGQVTGTVWQTTPLQPTQSHALPDLRVTRNPGAAVQVTNSEGRYSYTLAGALATISALPTGPFSVVNNVPGAEISASASGSPSSPVNLNFAAASEAEIAQTSALYWTNATYQLAKSILDPVPGKPFLNLPTNVNIASTCNAFWNGTINFYASGGGCSNTAYSDVVAHEYGHGIDTWRGGILDGGYSEGFGDAIAILVTRQSCLGRDFLGAGTCLRPATVVDLWPPPTGTEVHAVGKRYAQFVWQLVQELKKTYSEDESFRLAERLVLASAAANPSNIPNAVQLSFVADDTDGNLANGTPHCKELAAAAASRNIPHPNCPPDRLGYLWADNPVAASYTPSTTYSYNSAGGPILMTRSAAGTYQAKFTGLGGSGLSGGNVQVTPYGAGTADCRVASWGSAGADFVVNVRCTADSTYTLLVNWR